MATRLRKKRRLIEWTAEIDALLGTVTDATIAAQLNISGASVFLRRSHLGIRSFRAPAAVWTVQMDILLGTATDSTIATRLGIGRDAVTERRHKLNIPAFTSAPVVWTPKMDKLLGTAFDADIAEELGIRYSQVLRRRHKLGIPSRLPQSESLKMVIARAGPLSDPVALAVAPTERRFLIEQPQFRMAGGTFPDTEDRELTAYLTREFDELYTQSLRPIACPYCDSRHTMVAGKPHAKMSIPRFICTACKRTFNRLTGTPLARLRNSVQMPAFIRLLSQQLPYEEACKRLQLDYSSIANWTKKFRFWLLQLDPSGKWEARVRLGIKPGPHIPCPRCGADGEKNFFGSSPSAGRRLLCPACSTTFSVRDAERLAEQKVRLEVRYDPGKLNLNPGDT